MYKRHLYLLSAFFLLLLAGCGAPRESLPTPTPDNTDTPSPAPTATLTPVPSPTEPPTSTPTPGPLTAVEIFDLVSPSVALVETEAFSGSGLLTDGGYVVTNASVVWPYSSARVVFPDGSEFLDTPVAGWDLLADIALLGPIDTTLEPIPLSDTDDGDISSTVFLISYPTDPGGSAQPAIFSGLLARKREWDLTGLSYLQTDAPLGGGQGSGVVVTDRGNAIGISRPLLAGATFNVISSLTELAPRIQKLVEGTTLPDDIMPPLSFADGQKTHEFTIPPNGTTVFVVDMPAGERIEFEFTGSSANWYWLIDPAGATLLDSESAIQVDQPAGGETVLSGPHFLVLGQGGSTSSDALTLTSNQELSLYRDLDDEVELELGQTYYGTLDYAGDYDYFSVPLTAGETIHVKVESVMVDPFILIAYEGAGDEQLAQDDDTGAGVLGTDAELAYTAPHSGTYQLFVFDSYEVQSGGYAITVEPWEQGQPTPIVPPPTPTPIASEYGDMRLYAGETLPYTFQVPIDLTDALALIPDEYRDACSAGTACQIDPTTGLLLFVTESSVVLPDETTVEDVADIDIQYTVDELGATLVRRAEVTTGTGTQAVLLRYEYFGTTIDRLLAIVDKSLFSASYSRTKVESAVLDAIVAYSFSTFEVTE